MPISKIKTSSILADAASTNLNIDAGTLFLDATNNRVGIGTTSPATKLQVVSDSPIRMNNAASTSQADLYFADSGATLKIENFFGTGSNITFGTNASGSGTVERMRIDSSGNVGIGTSPGFKLQVSGAQNANDIVITNTTISSSLRMQMIDVYGNIFTTGSYPLTFGTNSAERMRIDSSGNVGIGTTSVGSITGGKMLTLYNNSHATLSIQAVDGGNDRSATLELLSSGNGGSYSQILYGDTDTTPGTASPLVFAKYHSGVRTETMRIDSGANLLVTGGYIPSNTSRLVVRGFSGGGYNNTFSQTNATVQIISNEMNNDAWNPTLNIAMIRQSLTTGKDSFGGIGFSTIDDSNNAGMHDAGRIAIVNEQASAVASPTSMAFYTQVGSATQTNAANERMRITGDGKVLIGTTSKTDNALLSVVEGSNLGGVYVGQVKNSTNFASGAIIMHKLGQTQGFQFSGAIYVNSWTGNAYIDVNIIVSYTNDAISYQVLSASNLNPGVAPKTTLQLATVSYAGSSWLAVIKNGGGTGVAFVNGMSQNNVGFFYEVSSGNYSVTTTHATLN